MSHVPSSRNILRYEIKAGSLYEIHGQTSSLNRFGFFFLFRGFGYFVCVQHAEIWKCATSALIMHLASPSRFSLSLSLLRASPYFKFFFWLLRWICRYNGSCVHKKRGKGPVR